MVLGVEWLIVVGVKEDGIVSHGVVRTGFIVELELKMTIKALCGEVDTCDPARIQIVAGATFPPLAGHIQAQPNQRSGPLLVDRDELGEDVRHCFDV